MMGKADRGQPDKLALRKQCTGRVSGATTFLVRDKLAEIKVLVITIDLVRSLGPC